MDPFDYSIMHPEPTDHAWKEVEYSRNSLTYTVEYCKCGKWRSPLVDHTATTTVL